MTCGYTRSHRNYSINTKAPLPLLFPSCVLSPCGFACMRARKVNCTDVMSSPPPPPAHSSVFLHVNFNNCTWTVKLPARETGCLSCVYFCSPRGQRQNNVMIQGFKIKGGQRIKYANYDLRERIPAIQTELTDLASLLTPSSCNRDVTARRLL